MENQTTVAGPRSSRVSLTLNDLTLSAGLACFSLDAAVSWQFDATAGFILVSGFTGTVSVLANGSFAHVGRLYPLKSEQARMSTMGPRSGAMALRLDLNAAQMAALEDARSGHGGDLLFLLQLDVEFFDADDKRPPSVQGAQLRITMEQSAWIKRLASAGYARTLVIEVPALEDDADPDHVAAVELFRKSRALAEKGEYQASIATARAVLERLESAEKDKDAIASDKDFAKHLEGMKSWSKAKRVQFVRRALRSLTDAAAHADDHTIHIEWQRKDALAIILFQSGLLRLVSKR